MTSSFVTKNLAVVLVDFVVRAFRFAITIKLAITSRTVRKLTLHVVFTKPKASFG